MGQKMSALRRGFRGVKHDAHVQCERDIDGSLSRVTSSEDECAVPSSNMIESVQSGIIRVSSEVSHRIRESEMETILKSLLKLSTDLILEIADYLPPSSYMSLSYSCWRIRNGMGASIEHILGVKF